MLPVKGGVSGKGRDFSGKQRKMGNVGGIDDPISTLKIYEMKAYV
jgi:hypothetical protein